MTSHTAARLSTMGVIRVEGADAASFLRNQLTNDVMRLGPDRHFLAGWCDAKGRTQMVAQVVATADCWYLLLPQDILPGVIKRLTMYVLRSKVTLTDVSQAAQVMGHLDHPDAPAVNRTSFETETLHLGLPSTTTGQRRSIALAFAPTDDVETPGNAAAWDLAAIDAGVPEVIGVTQGEFVPQMLNLHWLMAIDFDKGCYPGQEVVARLHYRGRLTRRVFRLQCTGAAPDAGADILDGEGKRCGTVLQAATANDESRLLAVVAVDRIASAITLADGRGLDVLELPYATPD